jgi:DNA polymerase-3 subunit beta
VIVAEDNAVKIKSSGSQFRLATESFDTFPAIETVVPDHSETCCVVSELVASLSHTLPLCDETSVKYALGGVLFDMSPQGSSFVSTDARRLMWSKRDGVKIGGAPLRFILPSAIGRSMLSLLKRQDQASTVVVRLNPKRMVIVGDSFEIVTPSLEGRFPDWRSLMHNCNCELVVAAVAGDLKRSCRLANVMTSEEHQGVRFSFGDKIELTSGSGGGESAVRLVGETRTEMMTELMAKYVLDAVTGWPDHEVVEWRQQNGDSAIYLHLPDEMVCCIMPMAVER